MEYLEILETGKQLAKFWPNHFTYVGKISSSFVLREILKQKLFRDYPIWLTTA
jgi:hypothetical protein